MTKKDIIFATVCGLSVSWLAFDFFGKYGLIAIIILPILSIIGLWVVELIGKKLLFVHQAGKFALAGAFADVVDIKVFQLVFLFLPFSLPVKAISFIVGTFVKYFSDKHWAFEKPDKENMHKEIAKFFLVAMVGLGINVVSFYFFSKMEVILPAKIWQELSIILAALVTAIWNFTGYKFLVFKK
jgi:putative flippase GtrA